MEHQSDHTDYKDQLTEMEARLQRLEAKADSHVVVTNTILLTLNLLVAGYVLKALVLSVPVFEKVFKEMLGDEPLPMVTHMLTEGRTILAGVVVFCLIGLVCFNVATRFRHRRAKLVNGIFLAIHAFALMVTWQGLLGPFVRLIEQLGA